MGGLPIAQYPGRMSTEMRIISVRTALSGAFSSAVYLDMWQFLCSATLLVLPFFVSGDVSLICKRVCNSMFPQPCHGGVKFPEPLLTFRRHSTEHLSGPPILWHSKGKQDLMHRGCSTWLWLKNGTQNRFLGKWTHRPTPAVCPDSF